MCGGRARVFKNLVPCPSRTLFSFSELMDDPGTCDPLCRLEAVTCADRAGLAARMIGAFERMAERGLAAFTMASLVMKMLVMRDATDDVQLFYWRRF
jgi:hypothetical protein